MRHQREGIYRVDLHTAEGEVTGYPLPMNSGLKPSAAGTIPKTPSGNASAPCLRVREGAVGALQCVRREQPCVCEKRRKLKVKLSDGKERTIQHMSATTFWGPDGKPISAAEFIQRLFGDLPALFRKCAEAAGSYPDTTVSVASHNRAGGPMTVVVNNRPERIGNRVPTIFRHGWCFVVRYLKLLW